MNLKNLAHRKSRQIDLRLFLRRPQQRGLESLVLLMMLGSLGEALLCIEAIFIEIVVKISRGQILLSLRFLGSTLHEIYCPPPVCGAGSRALRTSPKFSTTPN